MTEIENFYEELSKILLQSQQEVSYFYSFCKAMTSPGLTYSNSIKSLVELSMLEYSNSINDEFYRKIEVIAGSITKVMNDINMDIIRPSEIYHQNLSTIYDEMLLNINEQNKAKVNQRNKLNDAKIAYYNEYIKVEQMEAEALKLYSYNKSQQQINESHDRLMFQRSNMESKSLNYKREINAMNKLNESSKTANEKFKKTIESTENNKEIFLHSSIKKITVALNDLLNTSLNIIINLGKMINNQQMNDNNKELQSFLDRHMNKKCDKEHFISYDSYKKLQYNNNIQYQPQIINLSDSIASLNKIFQENNESSLSYIDKDFLRTSSIIINKNNNQSPSTLSTIIISFITSIFNPNDNNKDNQIKPYYLHKILKLNDEHKEFPSIFITSYLNYNKKPRDFFKISNMANLTHLTNVFNTIISNLDNNSSISEENIAFLNSIILIGEKTYCTINGIFLSAKLSNNSFFQKKINWLRIIEAKMIDSVKTHVQVMADNNQNTFFNNITKLLIGYKNEPDNALVNKIKQYQELNEDQRSIVNCVVIPDEFHLIMKSIIPHMCNYRFDKDDIMELIMELCERYKIKDGKINYYIAYINTSNCSIMRKVCSVNIGEEEHYQGIKVDQLTGSIVHINKEKINAIKKGLGMGIRQEKLGNNENCNKRNIIKVFSFALQYLPIKSFISLMILNHDIYNKISRKIYKHVLLHPQNSYQIIKVISNNKTRIAIWSCLLRVSTLKKIYPYDPSLYSHKVKQNNIIDLDVQRTFFPNNISKCRIALSSILHTFINTNSKIFYCQGMNYIAAFLYTITNENEELAFHLLNGLFTYTDFYMLFLDDLKRLRSFFYVFDRLMLLYLPEMYYYFISESFSVNYFASPWLITLFTNANDSYKSLVVFKIWDLFLLKEWRGLMGSVLSMLKYHHNEILRYENDALLQFMINELCKSSLFRHDHDDDFFSNVDIFLQIYQGIHIPKQLVLNIEKEIQLESSSLNSSNKLT